MKKTTLQKYIKRKPHLVWYVKNLKTLSDEAIIEAILNYGDFNDIRKMIKIFGIKNTAYIFNTKIKQKRNNYYPKIANYFKLYFKKYA